MLWRCGSETTQALGKIRHLDWQYSQHQYSIGLIYEFDAWRLQNLGLLTSCPRQIIAANTSRDADTVQQMLQGSIMPSPGAAAHV